MRSNDFDEIFNIIRQNELRIRTLQLLAEYITAHQTGTSSDLVDWSHTTEREILMQIAAATATETDVVSEEFVGTHMSKMVGEFFANVRQIILRRTPA